MSPVMYPHLMPPGGFQLPLPPGPPPPAPPPPPPQPKDHSALFAELGREVEPKSGSIALMDILGSDNVYVDFVEAEYPDYDEYYRTEGVYPVFLHKCVVIVSSMNLFIGIRIAFLFFVGRYFLIRRRYARYFYSPAQSFFSPRISPSKAMP